MSYRAGLPVCWQHSDALLCESVADVVYGGFAMRFGCGLLTAIVTLALSSLAVAQTAPPGASAQEPDVNQLEDVVVVAPEVEQAATAFVASVSAPSSGREAATWRRRICVGVTGMALEPGRALADRVSDWGHSLNLEIGPPGCRPNIIVIATDDGDATARELVASRPGEFHTGSSGTDRGRAALRRFQDSDRPVRWWHVSLPVDEDTSGPLVRLPGQAPYVAPPVITRPTDLGSYGVRVLPSRLYDHVRDDLQQVVIILEASALDHADFGQVADFVSMVALAQVDPEVSPEVASILRLFETGAIQEPTLSGWDQAYLRALYGSRLRGLNQVLTIPTMAAEVAKEFEKIREP